MTKHVVAKSTNKGALQLAASTDDTLESEVIRTRVTLLGGRKARTTGMMPPGRYG